jgi:hypothetical protein
MGMITGDCKDTMGAFRFINNHLYSASSALYYLPEVIVNSSTIILETPAWITNRIVQLQYDNSASSNLKQLSIGAYYASPMTLGYLGAD